MLLIRWAHAVAAVAWVGGIIFFHWVLSPSYRSAKPSTDVTLLRRQIGSHFRELVQLCTWAFVITGVLLTFDRLTKGSVGITYVALLAVKIGLAVWMFYLARSLGSYESAAAGQDDPPGQPAKAN